jgi:pilus assembly protein CpaF
MSLLKRIGQQQQQQPQQSPQQQKQSPERAPVPPPVTPEPSSGSLDKLLLRRQVTSPARDTLGDLKKQVQERLLAELDSNSMDLDNSAQVRQTIETAYNNILARENIALSRQEREQLFEQIVAEIIGYGPIEPLLADEDITEIMVNGPRKVYIERGGKIIKTPIVFESNEHVARVIDRIIAPLGRRCDESSPYVDARLPAGHRVNAIIPPLSLVGPVLTIRKFRKSPLTVDDMIRFGTMTQEVVGFLRACVEGRLNAVISGGTGSGKTTLLNLMSSFIPSDERIVTIENAAELQLRQEHVITLESRPSNIEGKGEITIRDLMINSLRMRPDRIVIGECRAAEALDMLQAMNTGHDGSMTTLHANSPRDALARLETMCLMSGLDLPLRAIREQIASAIDLVVQEERMRDGSRKVVAVTEVQGMEGDVVVLQDIFAFENQGVENGKIMGKLKPTGVRPKFTEKLEAHNIFMPPEIFGYDRNSYR